MTATAELTVLPKQLEFIDSNMRETLYSGAVGAGKSYAIALLTAIRGSVKGAREALCRKHLVTLKATTLRTLLDGDGDMPPVLPKGTYTHNKSEKIIRIREGGEIVYFGLDEPDKIGSYNLTGVNVDEAVELTEHDWVQLLGRIRLQVAGLGNRISGACNPGPPSHFLAERFGLAMGYQPQPDCFAVRTRTTDNLYLPKEYVQSVSRFRGTYRKRYFLGEWVGSEGLIYDNWNREVHVCERSAEWVRSFVTVDEGAANPFVALLVHEDSDGRLHVAREFYYAARRDQKPNLLVSEKVERIRSMGDVYEVTIDPSAAQLIAECKAAGLHAVQAVTGDKRNVFKGIQRVQARLGDWGEPDSVDALGPGLTVDPSCVETIREFETYEWNETAAGVVKDEPKKEHDHAMDALRYLITRIDATGGVGAATFSPSEARKVEDRPEESALARFQRLRENPDWGFE